MTRRLLAVQLEGSPDYPSVLYGISTYRDGLFYVCSYLMSQANYEIDMCQCRWGQTPLAYDCGEYDAILVSALGHQVHPNTQMLAELRQRTRGRVPIIMGGPHATFAPYEALRYADYAVIGSGELPAGALLSMIFEGRPPTADTVPDRVALMSPDGALVIGRLSQQRPPMVAINPLLYRNAPRLHWATVSFSRGCPYRCTFCYGVRIHGHRLTKKAPEVVEEELRGIHEATQCPNFYISDLSFGIDNEYAHRIADTVRGKGYSFVALCRLDAMDDTLLVADLIDAGFSDVLFGVEALDESVLASYQKRVEAELQTERLRVASERGMAVHASFVFGADGQTYEDVLKAADWCAENHVSYVCFAMYTDYPYQDRLYGAPQMFADWRIMQSSPAYQHYSFVSVYPRSMRPSRLQRTAADAYRRFIERRLDTAERSPRVTKIKMWARNMKYTIRQMEAFAQYLETVEHPYYDSSDQLLEDRLREHYAQRVRDSPDAFEHVPVVRPDTSPDASRCVVTAAQPDSPPPSG